jgi:O-antigen ligase
MERLAFGAGQRDVASAADSSGLAPTARPLDGPPAPSRIEGPSQPPSAAASARRAAPSEPRDWAFTWTLVFTAILFLRPQDVIPPLAALHLAELSALAGLTALFVGRLARRQPITRMTPEFIGVLAFGAIILGTAPFSIWIGGSIGVFTDLYAKVILVYLLAVNVIESPRRLERLTWLLVLSIGYLGFRAVFDYARGVNLIARGTRVAGSVGGIMQNPNDLALNMTVFIPLAALMAMRPGSLVKRLIAAGCAACMMGAIVASGSRGGFLGFAAMLVVLAAFAARQRPAFVLAGALAVMCALPLAPASYWRRIASITDSSKDDYQSSEARKRLFGESFDAFLQNPITGVGAGEFKDWNPQKRMEAWHESHNVWLQVGAELGIFGLAAYMFLVGQSFVAALQTRRLLKRLRPARPRRRAGSSVAEEPAPTSALTQYDFDLLDGHSAAMTASLVGWFVCAFFASVAYNWTFYYLLALAATPREMLRALVPTPRAARAAAAAPGRVPAAQTVEVRA